MAELAEDARDAGALYGKYMTKALTKVRVHSVACLHTRKQDNMHGGGCARKQSRPPLWHLRTDISLLRVPACRLREVALYVRRAQLL